MRLFCWGGNDRYIDSVLPRVVINEIQAGRRLGAIFSFNFTPVRFLDWIISVSRLLQLGHVFMCNRLDCEIAPVVLSLVAG